MQLDYKIRTYRKGNCAIASSNIIKSKKYFSFTWLLQNSENWCAVKFVNNFQEKIDCFFLQCCYGTVADSFTLRFYRPMPCMGYREWLACSRSKAVCCQYPLSAEKTVDKRIRLPPRLCHSFILAMPLRLIPYWTVVFLKYKLPFYAIVDFYCKNVWANIS